MKKFLVGFVALAVAVAVAAPALAKVEFSYGGQFRVRWFGQSNFCLLYTSPSPRDS